MVHRRDGVSDGPRCSMVGSDVCAIARRHVGSGRSISLDGFLHFPGGSGGGSVAGWSHLQVSSIRWMMG